LVRPGPPGRDYTRASNSCLDRLACWRSRARECRRSRQTQPTQPQTPLTEPCARELSQSGLWQRANRSQPERQEQDRSDRETPAELPADHRHVELRLKLFGAKRVPALTQWEIGRAAALEAQRLPVGPRAPVHGPTSDSLLHCRADTDLRQTRCDYRL